MIRARPPKLTTNYIIFGHFLSLFAIMGAMFALTNEIENMNDIFNQERKVQARRTHVAIIDNFMKPRQNWNTSILGSRLFKFSSNVEPQTRKFFIYIHSAEILSYEKRPLERCSVTNCIYTRDAKRMPTVDAVLINMHTARIPNVTRRTSQHRWIYWDDESPPKSRIRRTPLKTFVNIFNWTMTYRIDADVPIPYGRTVPLDEPLFMNFDPSYLAHIIPNWAIKRRDKLVAILMSNCLEFRMKFIKRLQKYIPVDIFGKCSSNNTLKYRCPGHIKTDCDAISAYIFYLAIENSDCREYISEKVWYNAYLKGSVPIIVGPPLSDCERLLPPNSFLYISTANNETEIKELADRIIHLSEDDDLLLSLHKWRNHFKVIYEHGGYGNKAVRLCRLCEGLNYNDGGTKIYHLNDLKRFFGPKLLCGNKICRRCS